MQLLQLTVAYVQHWYTHLFASDRRRAVVHVWQRVPPAPICGVIDCPRGSRFKAYADNANRTMEVPTECTASISQQQLLAYQQAARKERMRDYQR